MMIQEPKNQEDLYMGFKALMDQDCKE